MPEWLLLERDGVRLALADLGGSGPAVLLLHGLAGHAEEWTETASWLATDHHVFALDARGHGRSERRPEDLTHAAMVDDVITIIDHIGEPITLVGQSLGGVTSILVASARPDLVQGLIVAEASPAAANPQAVESLVAEVERKLTSWPIPFKSREDATAFFGGPSVTATAWVDGLEAREGGLWPRFDVEVMVRMLRATVGASQWQAWGRIESPVLIVRGERGSFKAVDAQRMLETLSTAKLVQIADAGHDVHLDRPGEWRRMVSEFLTDLA